MADGVTVAEAAAILGVSVDVVRKRLQRGTLAGEKQGRTWLVTLRQDATGHRQDTQKPSSRETVSMTGQPTGHRQDTDRIPTVGDRTRQDTRHNPRRSGFGTPTRTPLCGAQNGLPGQQSRVPAPDHKLWVPLGKWKARSPGAETYTG
jgi:excisionase family DNA binding protein